MTKRNRSNNGHVAHEEVPADETAITAEYLVEDIERLKQECNEYTLGAQRQIAAYNGAIQYAEQMLERLKGPDAPQDVADITADEEPEEIPRRINS